MSILRTIYLGLALLGAILPIKFYIAALQTHGVSLSGLVTGWQINSVATGLLWDSMIAAVALTIWILAEVYVRKDYWIAPVCILATFFIGVGCGLPLYLFLRTRGV